MRCPKCGYVSFDHNESCPKCNKNLSPERQRLNLITFAPDPPYLLGGLLGEVNESGMHLHSAGSGAFNVLQEELEFESETEEMEVSATGASEETEIEVELDSITDEEEILTGEGYGFDTTEADTITTTGTMDSPQEELEGLEAGDSLSLELDTGDTSMAEQGASPAGEEPEPLVFEMEDITLEETMAEEEFDLEPAADSISEAPTQVFDTAGQDESLTLEEEVSAVHEISEESEEAGLKETAAITEELGEERESEVPEPEIEPPLSLEELKDDELGEVDVTIDDMTEPTHKIADGHGG